MSNATFKRFAQWDAPTVRALRAPTFAEFTTGKSCGRDFAGDRLGNYSAMNTWQRGSAAQTLRAPLASLRYPTVNGRPVANGIYSAPKHWRSWSVFLLSRHRAEAELPLESSAQFGSGWSTTHSRVRGDFPASGERPRIGGACCGRLVSANERSDLGGRFGAFVSGPRNPVSWRRRLWPTETRFESRATGREVRAPDAAATTRLACRRDGRPPFREAADLRWLP
jgi:hypothetical protein